MITGRPCPSPESNGGAIFPRPWGILHHQAVRRDRLTGQVERQYRHSFYPLVPITGTASALAWALLEYAQAEYGGMAMGHGMKRFLIGAVSVLLLLGFTAAFAAEKAKAPPAPPRVPEMSTAGKVTEVTATLLKVERTLKGEAETMEFVLEKPFADIAVGDQIKVSYREKDGRLILIRVAPAKMTAVQKPKKDPPRTAKQAAGQAAPVTK